MGILFNIFLGIYNAPIVSFPIFYTGNIVKRIKKKTFEKYCAYDDHFVDFSILPSKPLKEVQNFNILSYFYEFKNIRKRRKKKTKKIRVD
ncbi:hypothetical protein PFTANZ_00269 [Plasmodium falciparum Tanzania (2000708)]|uniref:Uncharacterized protein n=1 Tax=Plasmodium falciparum Tanzania (2000708) TaxID=1036725 RepID=A0A024WEY9_PLAFA|nr:hypothetical protein PFTANZ_00269 [Plasmodium falciparum Tanzania (2000708)]